MGTTGDGASLRFPYPSAPPSSRLAKGSLGLPWYPVCGEGFPGLAASLARRPLPAESVTVRSVPAALPDFLLALQARDYGDFAAALERAAGVMAREAVR